MKLESLDIVRLPLAAIAGIVIGWVFGLIQNAALRRHQKLQLEGKLASGWNVVPGSFGRIAYLLVALVVVQVICPLLFAPGSIAPWFVSGGLVIGYGWTLFQQLRQRQA
jgi:hypothetical protein